MVFLTVVDAAAIGMEDGDLSWYRDILMLPDAGGVLGQPKGGVKATKADCVAAFGQATVGGQYMFCSQGSIEYESYISELLERTLQKDVQKVCSLPYQFARGLLDEENGELVNWTLFAIRRQSRYARSKSISDHLLPKYRGLKVPCPFRHPRVPLGKRLPVTERTEWNCPPLVSTRARFCLFWVVM
jgi:hypothetical protein